MQILGLSLFVSLALPTGMRLGQWGVSPWLGRLADRWGNRPVMIVSQLLVAAGLLFFAVATPRQWAWLVGAWALWVAYAGLNVCLPNLMLRLSPEHANGPYIAAFEAARGLCYAASTVLGGLLVDRYGAEGFRFAVGPWLSFFPCLFLIGSLMRGLGAGLLLLVVEPKDEGQAAGKIGKSCQNGRLRPAEDDRISFQEPQIRSGIERRDALESKRDVG